MSVPYYYGPTRVPATDRFARDRFLLSQKVLSLGGKYHVYDETGHSLFFVDRPVFKIKSDIGVYTDESRASKLLTLRQEGLFHLMSFAFTVLDERGQPLARLRREGWISLLRRTWRVEDTTGHTLAVAREDSWWKAIARRVPYLDSVGRLICTNFIITRPNNQPLGQFVRRFTLADRYVLDLSADAERTFDRRIALALAIVLDNAETR